MDSNLVCKLETPFLVDFSANIAVGDHKMRGMSQNGVFPKKITSRESHKRKMLEKETERRNNHFCSDTTTLYFKKVLLVSFSITYQESSNHIIL